MVTFIFGKFFHRNISNLAICQVEYFNSDLIKNILEFRFGITINDSIQGTHFTKEADEMWEFGV